MAGRILIAILFRVNSWMSKNFHSQHRIIMLRALRSICALITGAMGAILFQDSS